MKRQLVLYVTRTCFLATLVGLASCHNFGSHHYITVEPTGTPALPEILGAFEVSAHVRFESTPEPYCTLLGLICYGATEWQAVFEYSNPTLLGGQQQVVYFGQVGSSNDIALRVDNSGSTVALVASNVITDGELALWTVGVQSNGYAYIKKNGSLVNSATHSGFVPASANRATKYVGYAESGGGGLFSSLLPLTLGGSLGTHIGTIAGFQVNNLDQGTTFMQLFEFANLHGHPVGTGLVICFWLRVDDTSRASQRIFTFSGAGGVDEVSCTAQSANMVCGVKNGAGTTYSVTTHSSITSGITAYWHFGVENNGRMYIEKDGTELVSDVKGVNGIPSAGVRSTMLYGSSDGTNNLLDGLVLGLRVDQDRS